MFPNCILWQQTMARTAKTTRAELGLLFIIKLILSIAIAESKCSKGCDLSLASYYAWRGSNFTFISKLFNTEESRILQFNQQIPNPDAILVDIRINIPFSCDCIDGEFLGHVFNYSAQSTDTYYLVANLYYSNLTTADWLQRFNSYAPSMIPDDALLNVTVNCSCWNSSDSNGYGLFVTYPLQPEDSLSSIVNSFGVAPSLLSKYNPDANFDSGSGLVYIPGQDMNNAIGDGTGLSTQGLSTQLKVLIGVFSGVGVLLLILLVIYRRILLNIIISYWNDKVRSPTNVELFLENHGSRFAQRFKYSDIKKMTNSLQDKLGQGGYGSVFKGKLFDGRPVAVKVLSETKGNGEEFINEVTTIGTTNHVNVVSLLGFCAEGTKRALVYEFMPNGSLEKFIYQEKEACNPLGAEQLYRIALGIARGLDYLHHGCNTRILHLDIKPHNILLDQDFVPKISDFGLAKLCPPKESFVSIHGPRGTLGYIAPEVYGLRFGGVSQKSDVYSYGIMVLEMIGGRKNIDKTVNSSEAYLPQLIYNRFQLDINVDDDTKKYWKDETTKKMIVVALWCIQTHPANRPATSKVVEMFEGNVESLQMPPDPFVEHPVESSVSWVNTKESRNYLSESSLGGR